MGPIRADVRTHTVYDNVAGTAPNIGLIVAQLVALGAIVGLRLHGLVYCEFMREEKYHTRTQRSNILIRVWTSDPDPACLPENPQAWQELP